MQYEYFCETCQKVIEKEFPFGKAEDFVSCECGEKCKRHFSSVNFFFKGSSGSPSSNLKFKQEMTRKNEEAGKRMRQRHKSPKIVAHDFGCGDIREVKKSK